MPCLLAIYLRQPAIITQSVLSHVAVLCARKVATIHAESTAALIHFCDRMHGHLSADYRVALLARFADFMQRPRSLETSALQYPIACHLRHSEHLRSLTPEKLSSIEVHYSTLFKAAFDASEWEVVLALIGNFEDFAKYAPTNMLNNIVTPERAKLVQRPISGKTLFDMEFMMESDLNEVARILAEHSSRVLAEDDLSGCIREARRGVNILQAHLEQTAFLSCSASQASRIRELSYILASLQSRLPE